LSRVLGQNLVDHLAPAQDFLGSNGDVRSLSTSTTRGLMNHYPTVRKAVTLARSSTGEQHGSHAGHHANSIGNHLTRHEIQRVINRHTCSNAAPWRVNIQVNILLRIFHLQEEQL